MRKSFVLELHGGWSKFAVEYDHSATADNLMAATNWPFELARSRHLRTVRNRSGTHRLLAQESMSALTCRRQESMYGKADPWIPWKRGTPHSFHRGSSTHG
jgi:hypothetical protein